jgi:hypothetical protein
MSDKFKIPAEVADAGTVQRMTLDDSTARKLKRLTERIDTADEKRDQLMAEARGRRRVAARAGRRHGTELRHRPQPDSEDHGRGRRCRFGDLTSEHTEEDAVEMVRARKLGVDAATDRAATRGINVHEFLEEFGKTGEMPKLDVPLELAGYVKGLQDFLTEYDPEPSATELLVADPDRRLAGRMDMRAVTRSKAMPHRAERVIDLKTSPKLSIWSGAHVQTQAYRLADMKCGGPETDVPIIVVVDAEGRFDVVDCTMAEEGIDAGLYWRGFLKPVDSACQSRNKLARAA